MPNGVEMKRWKFADGNKEKGDNRPYFYPPPHTRNMVSTVLTFLALLCTAAITSWNVKRVDKRMREVLMLQTTLVAESLDQESLASLTGTEADVTKPEYLRLKEQLRLARLSTPNIRFIYLMGGKGSLIGSSKTNLSEKLVFLLDDRPVGDKDESPAGMPYDDAPEGFNVVADTGQARVEGPYTDRWGSFVSGCVTIADSRTKKAIALFAMDFDASTWNQKLLIAGLLPASFGAAFVAALLLGQFLLRRRAKNLTDRGLVFRNLEAAIVLTLGIIVTGLVGAIESQLEQNATEDSFSELVASRISSIIGNIHDLGNMKIRGLAEFIRNSQGLDHTSFKEYTKHLTEDTSVLAWEWVPVVEESHKEEFEQVRRQEGFSDYKIWGDDAPTGYGNLPRDSKQADLADPNKDNAKITNPQKLFFPVAYVEPLLGNERALGFNLGSERNRLEAINQANDSLLPTASLPIKLKQDSQQQKTILVFHPVIGASKLRGYAVALLHPLDLLKNTAKHDTVHLRITALDKEAHENLVAETHSTDLEHSSIATEFQLPVLAFGGVFLVKAHAGERFYLPAQSPVAFS